MAKTFGFYPSDVHPGPTYYDRPDNLEDFEDDPNAPIKRIQEEVYEGPRPHEGIPLPLGTAPIEDVEISDLPDEPSRVLPDIVTNASFEGNLPVDPRPTPNILDPDYLMWDHYYGDTHHPGGMSKGPLNVIPGIPDPVPLQDERYEDYIERGLQPPAITPFDDSGRETGIASLYGQGPQWGSTNRRYEDEYRDHIARTGERMTYEEFARAWERVHQGKPHAGLR